LRQEKKGESLGSKRRKGEVIIPPDDTGGKKGREKKKIGTVQEGRRERRN